MARNYGLWGAIAAIFLLAILGVRSAANWLNGSTAGSSNDPVVSVEGRDNQDLALGENGTTQTNTRFGDQSDTRAGETITFSPLEKAGTYVQRQKRAERDAVVAATRVEVVPIANNNAVSAQSDTRVVQPAPANVSSTTNTQPSSSAPAAVPALW